MDVLILANASSGRGRGRVAAQHVADRLRAAGYRVVVVPVGPGTDNGALADHILRSNAVVAAGGDGTVHHAAGAILGAARGAGSEPAPTYHLPWGNENLFAREFGMDRRVRGLAGALERRRIVRVDVAWIRAGVSPVEDHHHPGQSTGMMVARLFLIMAGFGPDASVIHRLDAIRTRAVGHLAYVRPILAELWSPTFPRLRVSIDGRRVVDGVQGMLVVANSRQFATRLDPARRASLRDGVLDAVFMPCRSVARAIRWAYLCRFRAQFGERTLIYERGREIVVERCDGNPGLACQIDGESVRPASGPANVFTVSVEPGVLPVLLP